MNVKYRIAGITIAVAAAWFAASCGGSDPLASPTPSTGGKVASVSITMSPPGGGPLITGSTRQLSVSAKLESGEYIACAELGAWLSSDPTIATVSARGEVAGLAAGTVTISVNCFGTVGTLPLTVYQSVTLSGMVSDDRGSPLTGVLVWVRDSKFGHSTRTDGSGRYRLEGLPGGMRTSIEVTLDGHQGLYTQAALDHMTLDFTLPFVGFSVGGRISEVSLGPLGGVRVEVIEGTNKGASTTSTSWGTYTLERLLPGTFTLRASRAGYDTIERALTTTQSAHGVDFRLKPSYGSCLVSVTPVLFERFPSTGGDATVQVVSGSSGNWTTVSSVEWIQVTSGAQGNGAHMVVLRVLPMPAGAGDPREGMVRIGCSAAEGQTVRIAQVPNCQVTLAWAPGSSTTFPAAGGTGRVLVQAANPNCEWQVSSRDEWIIPTGVSRRMGNGETTFIVRENTTGARRVGTFVVGESEWRVEQQ